MKGMEKIKKIKVLIVDDSKVFCEFVARGLREDARIEVAGFAGDPFEARDMILELFPDVLVLDIEMPKMDGLTFLRKLMPQYPIPTVVVSGHEDIVLKALEAGAVDYVKKPISGEKEIMQAFQQELAAKVKIASIAKVGMNSLRQQEGNKLVSGIKNFWKDTVIAIGASTGGTEALSAILRELPPDMPGIVVVQHMPENFTKMYAERLNSICRMSAKEAQDGEVVQPGWIYIAPGGKHMKIAGSEGGYRISCFSDEKVNGHRPSVDILFRSVAEHAGKNAIGVILTGMGYDGAKGLLEMKRKGAHTIGQDEVSCIVYGMPKVAYDIGGVKEQLALKQIAQRLCSLTHI